MPGSGMTPALRPNCPGTHCPFCCASEGKHDIRTTDASIGTGLVIFISVCPLSCGRDWSPQLDFGYPVKSCPGLIFGYLAMLFSYSTTAGKTGSNIQPISIMSLNRLFLSPGSLPRSKTIGNCGCTIGLSKPSLYRNQIFMLCHFADIIDPSGPKKSSVSRPVVLLWPSKNFDASMPSIGRSVGTLSEAPARAGQGTVGRGHR